MIGAQADDTCWTQDAITIAAMKDPKLSVSMSGMLSPSELISWFMDDMNHQLRKKKEEEKITTTNENENSDVDVDVIFEAIQWRLKHVIPLVESGQWHHGMAMGLSTFMLHMVVGVLVGFLDFRNS